MAGRSVGSVKGVESAGAVPKGNTRDTHAAPGGPGAGRLASLDVARGLTLMFMIIVNNPGTWDHVFAPLRHAEWHGFTPTDFVFPNFLFIVGASIAFALSKRRAAGTGIGPIMAKVLRRGALLFLIGVSITAIVINFDFAHLRIPGVLQRIALVSVACSFLYLKLERRALAALAFGILALYYVLMMWVPVPGVGAANLGAETNLGAWLDRLVFSPDHLYRHTRTWDPEGLFSTLPAVSTGLFGLLAGMLLLGPGSPRAKIKGLLVPGVLFILAGAAAHLAFPINKSLWTSSFVLFTAGLSMVFLALCYHLVDLRGLKRGIALPIAFGMNSIFAYVCSEMFGTILRKLPGSGGRNLFNTLYEGLFASWIGPPQLASFVWSLAMLAAITPGVWVLYKKNILIKL